MADDIRGVWADRIRTERKACGWDKPEMARQLAHAAGAARADLPDHTSLLTYVKRWERGAVGISERYRMLYARALDMPEGELFETSIEPPAVNVSWLDIMDESRRRLLGYLTALGSGGVVPVSVLEPIRGALIEALSSGHDSQLLEDWDEIAYEQGHAFLTTPPAEMLPGLAADLAGIQDVIRRTRSGDSRQRLYFPAGKLAALIAMTVAALGDRRQAREWWAAARHTADASENRELRVWVRGHEAMSGLYSGRPFVLVRKRADEAIAIAGDRRPYAAALEAMAARAQMLALDGDHEEAESTMTVIERRFDQLEVAGADDRLAINAWPETALRHTQAYVHTHIGNAVLADRAQSAAQGLYPESMPRQNAQIELLRSLCMVRDGDVTGGLQHAELAVEPLGYQRTAGIRRGVAMVIAAVPEGQRRWPAVADRCEHLARHVGRSLA